MLNAGCLHRKSADRFCVSGEQQLPLISPPDRQLVTVQYLMYNTTIHACRSSLSLPHSFSRLHSSIHQSQLFLSVAPRSWNELPARVTIHQVSYYPSPLSCGDAPLWTKDSPIHPAFFLFSRAIHGSFHPFNGLDSSVSVIANLIFPSLKTWSISLLGSVWQTWKRQN